MDKQQVFRLFSAALDKKIAGTEAVLAGLKESGSNETKSTAGDKHETALAMLQIEQENTRAQRQALLSQKELLEQIDPSKTGTVIGKGSLVQTNNGCFFISTALGKIQAGDKTVIAISLQSPLGNALKGLSTGASVSLNGNTYTIEAVS